MSSEQEKDKVDVKDTENLELITYEQSMENIRAFITMAVTILTTLAVINVTILGYAFSAQKASALLLGSVSMLIAVVLHRSLRTWMIPYIYSAIQIERTTFKNDSDPTLNFALITLNNPKFLEKIKEISESDEPYKRAKILSELGSKGWIPDHLGSYALFCIAMILEALAALILMFMGWSLI